MTRISIYNEIKPEPGFPSGSGYISLYIQPLVTIQIQCFLFEVTNLTVSFFIFFILLSKVHADAINDLQYYSDKMATISEMSLKNPAYGRHLVSHPMRIEATIFFLCKKKIYLEQLLVFKALQVGPQMHQSTS